MREVDQQPQCVACEGKPAPGNDPCVVCGRATIPPLRLGDFTVSDDVPNPSSKQIDPNEVIERLRFVQDHGGGFSELAEDCISLIQRLPTASNEKLPRIPPKHLKDGCYARADALEAHLNDMTVQRDHWLETAREKDAEIERLRGALSRILNGPWPGDLEGPADQCRFDAMIAQNALSGDSSADETGAQWGGVEKLAGQRNAAYRALENLVATCEHDTRSPWPELEEARRVIATSPEETSGWQPVTTADINQLFASSTWVLIHTSDGRVTEGIPVFMDGSKWCWVAGRGNNCIGSEPSMLIDRVTHWMPRPQPPPTQKASALRDWVIVCGNSWYGRNGKFVTDERDARGFPSCSDAQEHAKSMRCPWSVRRRFDEKSSDSDPRWDDEDPASIIG